MRIVILNTDYPEFLSSFYQVKSLIHRSYDEQIKARNKSLFGVADYYSQNFISLGHEAWELHINNEIMQKKWAVEHGLNISPITQNIYQKNALKHFLVRVGHHLPTLFQTQARDWMKEILQYQIKQIKPDIILNQALEAFNGSEIRSMCGSIQAVIGQIASPLPENRTYYKGYDVIISSLPNFVSHFENLGIKSVLNRLAFEPSILSRISTSKLKRSIDVGFFGSITSKHLDRLNLMEKLAQSLHLQIWGNIDKKLLKNSPRIKQISNSPLWGIEMYNMMRKTKIIINHHIEIAGNYANNMRLFEATGMGALLITDWKSNLAEIFEPEREVVTYKTHEECREKIQYYLSHEEERERIALAGQKRTLAEHTYHNRATEIIKLVSDMGGSKNV